MDETLQSILEKPILIEGLRDEILFLFYILERSFEKMIDALPKAPWPGKRECLRDVLSSTRRNPLSSGPMKPAIVICSSELLIAAANARWQTGSSASQRKRWTGNSRFPASNHQSAFLTAQSSRAALTCAVMTAGSSSRANETDRSSPCGPVRSTPEPTAEDVCRDPSFVQRREMSARSYHGGLDPLTSGRRDSLDVEDRDRQTILPGRPPSAARRFLATRRTTSLPVPAAELGRHVEDCRMLSTPDTRSMNCVRMQTFSRRRHSFTLLFRARTNAQPRTVREYSGLFGSFAM